VTTVEPDSSRSAARRASADLGIGRLRAQPGAAAGGRNAACQAVNGNTGCTAKAGQTSGSRSAAAKG